MLLIITWIVLSMIVGVISSKRKLGEWGGFFISLLLSPLIGFIIVAFSPRKDEITKTNNVSSIADELEKFSKLRSSGAITEEEYQSQKAKLLK